MALSHAGRAAPDELREYPSAARLAARVALLEGHHDLRAREAELAREGIDRLLDRTAVLVETARALPSRVAAPGLRWECGVIVELAARLLLRLRRGDPLAARVKLHKSDFLAALLIGVLVNLRR